MIDTWHRHTRAEFELKDADAAIATMTARPVLVHVPLGTGATGCEELRKFYREHRWDEAADPPLDVVA